MLKERLNALAGPLTILVGSMWLMVSFGEIVIWILPVSSESFWDMFVAVWSIPLFLSFVPLLFALIGTQLRFHQSVGVLGKLGLILSVAGCAGVTVSMLAHVLLGGVVSEVEPRTWMNYATVGCLLSIRIGYILFGVDAVRYRPLPRWNLLPLLVGSTVVLGLPLEWFGVPAILPVQWANPFLHFAITGACWVLLGIAIIEPRQEPQPT